MLVRRVKWKFVWMVVCGNLLVALSGCSVVNDGINDWLIDVLGPISYTKLSINELDALTNTTFTAGLSAEKLGFAQGSYTNQPAFTRNDLPAISTDTLNEATSLTYESVTIALAAQNRLPFPLAAGTVFEVYSNAQKLTEITLTQPLEAGQSGEIAKFTLSNTTLAAYLVLVPKKIVSPGLASPFTIDHTAALLLTVRIQNGKISRAVFPAFAQSRKELVSGAFKINGDELKIDYATGNMNIKITNGFARDMRCQVYFKNDASFNTTIDSLFVGELPLIAAAQTDAQGNITQATVFNYTMTIDETRYFLLKETRKIEAHLVFLPATQPFVATASDAVEVQIIGDMQVKLRQ